MLFVVGACLEGHLSKKVRINSLTKEFYGGNLSKTTFGPKFLVLSKQVAALDRWISV